MICQSSTNTSDVRLHANAHPELEFYTYLVEPIYSMGSSASASAFTCPSGQAALVAHYTSVTTTCLPLSAPKSTICALQEALEEQSPRITTANPLQASPEGLPAPEEFRGQVLHYSYTPPEAKGAAASQRGSPCDDRATPSGRSAQLDNPLSPGLSSILSLLGCLDAHFPG